MAALTGTKDKVLVVGSNAGTLKGLLAKITGINSKHGPFTCVLCLGDLFPPSSSAAAASTSANNDSNDNVGEANSEAGDSDDADQDTKDVVEGKFAVPVPTYFMLGERKFPRIVQAKIDRDVGEVTENLFYLGKATSLTLASGLKIGVFGGQFDLSSFTSTSPVPASSPSFSSSSLQTFLSSPSSLNLDILLTHAWPSQISRYSEKPVSETVSKAEMASWGVPALQGLFGRSRPKYAFSGEKNLFWEREPFVYPAAANSEGEEARPQNATRFLSLGKFGNASKQRWFYAFTVSPGAGDVPTDVTPCPFDLDSHAQGSRGMKRPAPTDDSGDGGYIFAGADGHSAQGKKKRHGEPPAGYTCKICNVPGHFVQDCPEKVDAPPRRANGAPGPPPDTYVCRLCNVPGHWIQDCPMSAAQGQQSERRPRNNGMPKDIAPEECWFCLSNPKVTKHLIASIGSETYLTLPKGQLIETSDPARSLVPGGGHCLIIPIAHYPTLASVPSELSAPIIAEIDSYKRALRTLYAAHGASLLAYEVSRAGLGGKGGHAHIQICPVPNSTPSSQVEQIFRDEAAREGYAFVEDVATSAKVLEGGNYLRVDLPDGKRLVHDIRPGARFSLQFGRATTAKILGDEERSDWKACAKSDEEEGKDAQDFKKAFAQYDPSG